MSKSGGSIPAQRLLELARKALAVIAGLALIIVVLGASVVCQIGKGQVRPYVPSVVRPLFDSGDDQVVIDDYMHGVDEALESMLKETEECSAQRSQPCQTKAVEKAYRSVGDGVPVEAAWMSDAHERLRDALYEMWQINLRSEREPVTTGFVREAELGTDALASAGEDWYKQANR